MGNSYRSIISAFIYGLIASMPIVFLYIYKNWLLAVLSCLIPMAVSFGYKKHSSKVNKRSFLVIVLLSFFIILFLFLFAVPLIILYKQGMIVSFHNLVFLYEDETFLSDIGYTLFISILFAILGLIISIFSLRRTKNDATFDNSQDIALRIKEFFLSNNATDKNNAIDKKELNSIFDDYELRQVMRDEERER